MDLFVLLMWFAERKLWRSFSLSVLSFVLFFLRNWIPRRRGIWPGSEERSETGEVSLFSQKSCESAASSRRLTNRRRDEEGAASERDLLDALQRERRLGDLDRAAESDCKSGEIQRDTNSIWSDPITARCTEQLRSSLISSGVCYPDFGSEEETENKKRWAQVLILENCLWTSKEVSTVVTNSAHVVWFEVSVVLFMQMSVQHVGKHSDVNLMLSTETAGETKSQGCNLSTYKISDNYLKNAGPWYLWRAAAAK